MEAGGGRRRRGQRLLYFFRTPPAVRIGREAIDPEAMRLLEQHNPDVPFDWERILRAASAGAASAPAPAPGAREDRRRDRRDQRRPSQEVSRRESVTPATSGDVLGSYSRRPDAAAPGPAEIRDHGEPAEPMDARGPSDAVDGRAPGDPEDAPEVGELPAPREAMNDIEPAAAVEPAEPIAERYARLGADGLRRLRARYADLKVRLAARDLEAADRAVVTEQLERLNPDGWRSEQEVGLALEQYEAIYDAVRPIVGHPRRPRA